MCRVVGLLIPMRASDLFDLPDNWPFTPFFDSGAAPWTWLGEVHSALAVVLGGVKLINAGDECIPAGLSVSGQIYLGHGVKLPAYGTLQGPAYIGDGSELRPGVFIRGNVIVGENCVLGNACEFKNAILLNGVQVPHFSYVGDSILGNRTHLGAGAICSNLRLDQAEVSIKPLEANERIQTGRRKLGALVGDGAEAGCQSVLNPGTILMPGAFVGPGVIFSGTLPSGKLVRVNQVQKVSDWAGDVVKQAKHPE